MGPGWRKMLKSAFRAVLAELDEQGGLRRGSTLVPKFPATAG